MEIIKETSAFIVEAHPTKNAYRIISKSDDFKTEWLPCEGTIYDLYDMLSSVPLPEFRNWCMDKLYEDVY